MCLENYYTFLDLKIDVHSIVFNVKSIFFSLYDEYVKFYGPLLNINIQQDVLQAKPPPSSLIVKRYQLLFQKKKRGSGSSTQSLTSELQSYLTTTFEFIDSSDFEIL